MAFGSSRFKKSIAFKWLLSYSIILIIPVLISAFIYAQTGKIVEFEINRANNAMLKQVKYIVDSGVDHTTKLVNQLSINNEILGYINLTKETEPAYQFTIYKMGQEISKYRLSNDFIKDIYIYSKSLNAVLTPETYTQSDLFYNIFHKSDTFTYDKWTQLMNAPHTKEYIRILKLDNDHLAETTAYMQSLPIQMPADSLGTLVITLNNTKIEKILQNMDWVDRGHVVIVNANNQILFQNDPAYKPMIAYESMAKAREGSYFDTIDGEKVMVSYTTSEAADWKYVTIIPSRIFWEQAEYMRNLNLLGLFVCFVIGGVVIVVFARRNYNPINQMVRLLTGKAKLNMDNEQNEYEFIHKSIMETIRERDDINNKQLQQIKLLRGYFVSRMLKGQLEKDVDLAESLHIYKIELLSSQFAVLLFQIDSSRSTDKEAQLSQFIVSNIVQDAVGSMHSIWFSEIDGTLAALLNFSSEDTTQWKDTLEESLGEAKDFIEHRFRIQFTAAVSDVQTGFSEIHQAFLQALEALEYRMVVGEGQIVWYSDIRNTNHTYSYSVNQELVLLNLLKSGSYEEARQLVLDVLDHSFGQTQISMEMLKCVMIDLISTMMKSMDNEDNGMRILEELRPVRRILTCNTRLEIETELLDMIKRVCDYAEGKYKALSNSSMGDKVTEFVEAHYANPDLNVSLLGSHFSITPQYVSKLFKEQTGQGLHEYISQTRLKHAKRLLLEGATIDDTAQRVGFASSSAFIRVFKKFEGVTPGKFRTIH
ncbi:helix-turn-helix domain-containing protein [Paenibacillus periandrae]|uniref:helix-turn-helix domain-containing protein n=1 Tax=Paenibacillus periandrae TaxID=1761741 RepID=UPI001F09DEAC|nr:helix-turn-helix domain-containing protein [Paenibacillus periandrae]